MRLLSYFTVIFALTTPALSADDGFADRFAKALAIKKSAKFDEAAFRASNATRRTLMCGTRMTEAACDEKRKQFATLLSENRDLVIKTMITLSNDVFYKTRNYKNNTGALGLVLFLEDNPKAAAGQICVPPNNADYRCTILRGTFLDPAIVKLNVEAAKRAKERVTPYFK